VWLTRGGGKGRGGRSEINEKRGAGAIKRGCSIDQNLSSLREGTHMRKGQIKSLVVCNPGRIARLKAQQGCLKSSVT